jgi:hypothetical protein
MKKIPEKVVAARTPADVRINLDEVPKHQMDTLCRVVIRGTNEAFKDPKFAAEYEVWLAERRAKQKAVEKK